MKPTRNPGVREVRGRVGKSVQLAAFLVAAVGTIASAEVVSWTDGDLTITARPLIVTSSNPPTGGDRVTVPGNPSSSSGIDLDGVARLFLDVNAAPGAGALCSGSLLSDGQTLLTAAHCLTDSSGNLTLIDGADGNSATFQTGSGNVVRSFTSADVTIHPNYNGDLFDGFDIAVIDLGSPLPTSVTRYDLNDQASIEGLPHVAAGYGRSGDGATGDLLGAGTLRSGENQYESFGLPVGGITNPLTQLTADFDSGSSANDAFDFFFGAADTGQGTDEIGIAPGDSGGPTFILDGGTPVIAGVHSYGLRLNVSGASSDVDATLNSSFGEFYVDARVAESSVLSFIESNLNLFAPGDFDQDGDVDADDIDLLTANTGSVPPIDSAFDLNNDGVVDIGPGAGTDQSELVRGILGTEFGDANLDGLIDSADFSVVSSNFGQSFGWAGGDFNGDGLVGSADFSAIAGSFGFPNPGSIVPEPNALALLVTAAALATRRFQSEPLDRRRVADIRRRAGDG